MSTIITSLIIILLIITVVFVFKLVNKIHTKKIKDKLVSSLSHAGTKHGLSFTSQELLRDKVIGVDGINRKFVVVNEKDADILVDLQEVKSCHLQKSHGQVQYGNPMNGHTENRLATIGLLFEYENKKIIPVHFYDHTVHSFSEANALEAKARDWEVILSKLISAPLLVRA